MKKKAKKETLKLIINSAKSLLYVTEKISSMRIEHRHLTISIRPGLDRSVEQNSLWERMYERLVDTDVFSDRNDAKAYCKLMIGVPILKRDCLKFENDYMMIVGVHKYEVQLRLMGGNDLLGPNGFPVTSLMGTKQATEYTSAIADYFAEQNVSFEDILNYKD